MQRRKSCLQNAIRKELSNVRHRDRDSVSLYTHTVHRLCAVYITLCIRYRPFWPQSWKYMRASQTPAPNLLQQQICTTLCTKKCEDSVHKTTFGCTEPNTQKKKTKKTKICPQSNFGILTPKKIYLWYTIAQIKKKIELPLYFLHENDPATVVVITPEEKKNSPFSI